MAIEALNPQQWDESYRTARVALIDAKHAREAGNWGAYERHMRAAASNRDDLQRQAVGKGGYRSAFYGTPAKLQRKKGTVLP